MVSQLKKVGYGKSRMSAMIHEELQELLETISTKRGEPIWPGKEILAPSVINVLWAFITGSRIERTDEKLKTFLSLLHKRSKLFDLSGGLLCQIPWLRHFAPERTGFSLIQKLNLEFYEFFMTIIQEHLNSYCVDRADDDLIYAFIKEMKSDEENNEKSTTFTLKQLVMVILDLFIAGSLTTSTTIDLALMITLMKPDLQEKCYREIFDVLGVDGDPSYADRASMPFVEATLLEVQRFFHIAPLSGPRRVLQACKLGGYDIPENATVLIGLRSVLMDEQFWVDPEVFRPERFLDEKLSQVNIPDRFIPFGAGRRKCLGDHLAKQSIFTFYVGILQKFRLIADDNEPPSLDLLPGITLSPRPYKIVFKKR